MRFECALGPGPSQGSIWAELPARASRQYPYAHVLHLTILTTPGTTTTSKRNPSIDDMNTWEDLVDRRPRRLSSLHPRHRLGPVTTLAALRRM